MARHLIQSATTGQIRLVGTSALPFFQGYVELDTYDDGIPPAVFYGAGESDLRYVNVTELSDPVSAPSVALRAALGALFMGPLPTWLTAANAAKRFDPQASVYNLKPSNTKRYRAALGKAIAGTGLCDIVCAGESTTAGQGLTNTESAWPAMMRKSLVARGIPSAGNGATYAHRGSGTTTEAFGTFTGTWFPNDRFLYRNAVSNGATWTVTGSGTTLIIVSDDRTGVFTYAVDGGAATTVTAGGTTALRTTTVTGLSAGAHTLVITTVGTATVGLYSAEFRAATGVSVTNAGASGSFADDWSNTGTLASPPGFRNGAAVRARGNPHLLIFGLGINDLSFGTDAATYKARVLTTIQAFQAGGTADVILATSNGATGTWTTAAFDAYQKALYELADQLDVPLIDVANRMTYAEANSLGLMLDGFHPTAGFHAERGQHHARTLLSV